MCIIGQTLHDRRKILDMNSVRLVPWKMFTVAILGIACATLYEIFFIVEKDKQFSAN